MKLGQLLKWVSAFEKRAAGFRTLYHLSKYGPAQPKERMPHREREYFFQGEPRYEEQGKKRYLSKRKSKPRQIGWTRPWLPERIESGVFLTPDPVSVAIHQGPVFNIKRKGQIHIYDVAESIIKESGGIHIYDRAPEILISKEIWDRAINEGTIIYKGVMSKEKFNELITAKSKEKFFRLPGKNLFTRHSRANYKSAVKR